MLTNPPARGRPIYGPSPISTPTGRRSASRHAVAQTRRLGRAHAFGISPAWDGFRRIARSMNMPRLVWRPASARASSFTGGFHGDEPQDPRRDRRGQRETGGSPRSPISRRCARCPQFGDRSRLHDRQESAEAAARHFGVSPCVSDPEKLGATPDSDLVTVQREGARSLPPGDAPRSRRGSTSMRMAARARYEEAVRLLDAAERAGVRHAVGLQGQMSPAINYLKDLVAEANGRPGAERDDDRCCPELGHPRSTAPTRLTAPTAPLMTITGAIR